MSAVSEWIVREYLEAIGFLVHQPCKYQVMARAKRVDEEIDLVALNPEPVGSGRAKSLLWGARELRAVPRLLVGVRGWHTDRFSPAVLQESPEIFRFAADDTVRQAERLLGGGPVVKILCVPALPASRELRNDALTLLRERGIDGVLQFRTILLELAALVDVTKSYDKSDLMQLLRILKNYDLLKDAQLELFDTGRRRRGRRPRSPEGGEP